MYNVIISRFGGVFKGIISSIFTFFLSFSWNVAYATELPALSVHELKQYIRIVEKQHHIPAGLLTAIANVESGFKPYAINIDGNSLFASNASEATKVVENALSQGVTNIDIGIMQINYRWHKKNFTNVKEMLNPKVNIKYAGELLSSLRKKHGNWHKAIRYYHCALPTHYRKYSRKIVLEWLKYV